MKNKTHLKAYMHMKQEKSSIYIPQQPYFS